MRKAEPFHEVNLSAFEMPSIPHALGAGLSVKKSIPQTGQAGYGCRSRYAAADAMAFLSSHSVCSTAEVLRPASGTFVRMPDLSVAGRVLAVRAHSNVRQYYRPRSDRHCTSYRY